MKNLDRLNVRAVKIEVTDITTNVVENEYKVLITVFADHHTRKDENTMTIHHLKTDYVIGLENDVLKILSIDEQELSKTDHTISEDTN